MKHTVKAALILVTLVLSTACDLRLGTQGYAATDSYCGGNPSESCPLW